HEECAVVVLDSYKRFDPQLIQLEEANGCVRRQKPIQTSPKGHRKREIRGVRAWRSNRRARVGSPETDMGKRYRREYEPARRPDIGIFSIRELRAVQNREDMVSSRNAPDRRPFVITADIQRPCKP